jgi:Trk-type K+ transport system membrane component
LLGLLPRSLSAPHSSLLCYSLVDQSMVPFGDAYLLIVVMSMLILGGNTAYPVL